MVEDPDRIQQVLTLRLAGSIEQKRVWPQELSEWIMHTEHVDLKSKDHDNKLEPVSSAIEH
jgi:hypothetical protein